jgi:hypothetical protein
MLREYKNVIYKKDVHCTYKDMTDMEKPGLYQPDSNWSNIFHID